MRGDPPGEYELPEDVLHMLRVRHRLLSAIRHFFDARGYLEVETPVRVRCPGVDPHVDAFSAGGGLYLATSPELHMKRLLCRQAPKIYQITHAFRKGERGSRHNSEFTILEWYRTDTDYLGIMEEAEQLLSEVAVRIAGAGRFAFPLQRISVDLFFHQHAGWEPSRSWDESRYNRDWMDKIDPALRQMPPVFLVDFPAPLASLSRLHRDNPLLCERFELFINGLEIANAFTELTDPDEHEKRFDSSAHIRRGLGKVPYVPDDGFRKAFQSGLPESGGIAVGIDRLVMALCDCSEIESVMAFPLSRL